jgi:YegS/Rv2252/BmrU family lipid kinase
VDARQAAIILNPVSGGGDPDERRNDLLRAAHALGWRGQLLETTPQRSADALADQAIADGARHLIVAGGDGSIREALARVAGSSVQLGIVPMGTGNLFAINFGLPLDSAQALEIALFGRPTHIDIGRANAQVFGMVAGIGWDAALISDAPRELKKQLGLWAYFVAAARNFGHPAVRFTLTIDDRAPRPVRARSIVAANVGRITGGFEAVPGASPRDGLLNLAIITPESLLEWIRLVVNVFTRRVRDDPNLTLVPCRRVEISTLRPQPYELVGDAFPPTTKLVVEVDPQGATVMLPPGAPLA